LQEREPPCLLDAAIAGLFAIAMVSTRTRASEAAWEVFTSMGAEIGGWIFTLVDICSVINQLNRVLKT